MKERLEEIKHVVGYVNKAVEDDDGNNVITTLIELFSEGHIDWLIQQAELVQELKKQSHGIELDLLNDEVVRLEKQNKRYKQALEFYQNGLNYTWKDGLSPVSSSVMIDGGFKAHQALKGESR